MSWTIFVSRTPASSVNVLEVNINELEVDDELFAHRGIFDASRRVRPSSSGDPEQLVVACHVPVVTEEEAEGEADVEGGADEPEVIGEKGR